MGEDQSLFWRTEVQRRRDALKRGGRSRQVEKLTRVHGPELVGLFRQPTRLQVCLKAVALRASVGLTEASRK
jgi:hypothetical protein